MKEFEKCKTVRLWLAEVRKSRTGSDETQRVYLRILPRFCDWAGDNPDTLIKNAVDSMEPGKKSTGEILAGEWFDHLITHKNAEGRAFSRSFAKTCYGVVRSFYRANNIMFFGKTPSAVSRTVYKLPSKEMLQKAWRLADLPTKIRVGILNDTGMRPEDAVALNYGDMKQSFLESRDRIYIEKLSEKEDVKFGVCLSRPVTELVYQHIRERGARGEIMIDETPIMTRSKEPGKPITTNQLWRDVAVFGARVGAKMSPKTFRKRFRTYGSPVVGTDAICKMGGWSLPGVGRHYYLPQRSRQGSSTPSWKGCSAWRSRRTRGTLRRNGGWRTRCSWRPGSTRTGYCARPTSAIGSKNKPHS